MSVLEGRSLKQEHRVQIASPPVGTETEAISYSDLCSLRTPDLPAAHATPRLLSSASWTESPSVCSVSCEASASQPRIHILSLGCSQAPWILSGLAILLCDSLIPTSLLLLHLQIFQRALPLHSHTRLSFIRGLLCPEGLFCAVCSRPPCCACAL